MNVPPLKKPKGTNNQPLTIVNPDLIKNQDSYNKHNI